MWALRIKYFLFFLLLTSCTNSNKRGNNVNVNADSLISETFTRLDKLAPYIYIDGDSLTNSIAATLIRYREDILSLPVYPQKQPVIVRSEDQQLYLLSWDTRQGGTNIDYRALAFFKTSKGTDYRYPLDTSGEASTQILYRNIFELKCGSKTIYLARGFGRGSSALPWEQITAWSIRNDSLIPEPVFPEWIDNTNGKPVDRYLPSLFIEFDVHYNTGQAERPITAYTNRNTRIKVPLPNEDGGWSDRYYWLVFDGQHFNIQAPE